MNLILMIVALKAGMVCALLKEYRINSYIKLTHNRMRVSVVFMRDRKKLLLIRRKEHAYVT